MVVTTWIIDGMRYVALDPKVEVKGELDQRFQMSPECGSGWQIKAESGHGIYTVVHVVNYGILRRLKWFRANCRRNAPEWGLIKGG